MKNDSLTLVLALLVVGLSGQAHAQPTSIGKAISVAQKPAQRDSTSEYTPRGSGVIGRNYLLPGTSLPAVSAAESVSVAESDNCCQEGEAHAKKGNWLAAIGDYQRALSLCSGSKKALYGAAECVAALGDMVKAINYSRQAIYRDGAITAGFSENDTKKLMHFALLLNKAGQAAEAVSVYNHAAYALDYQDSQYNAGKPYLKALLPELVAERTLPTQERYTPERLQALAETAIAHEEMAFGSNKAALAHLRDAVNLYPDSPVTNYYLGEGLLRIDDPGAKAAYQKAAQLGDDQTVAAAKERISSLP